MSRHLLMLRVTVKDGERALLTRNGRFERVLGPGRHRLFDPLRALKVETFPVVRAEFPADRYAVLKAERPELAAELFEAVETRADELAIVSLDGRPTHLVGPWQLRVFWKVATAVEVERIDVGARPEGRPASPDADRPRAHALRGRDGGREPRGRPALCRGPAGGAAGAGPARLLDGRTARSR